MKKLLLLLSLMFLLLLSACDSNDDDPNDGDSDIPADPTDVVVPQTTINNIKPTSNFTKNGNRVKMNITGIINPSTQKAIQFNPQNNLFVTEDNVVKGLKVTKASGQNVLQADIVFTVDNSGSMNQESDSVAAGIVKFANYLLSNGLDVKFGIVGYDMWGDISGAINFTDALTIEQYLGLYNGTDRTKHFAGPDSASLQQHSVNYAKNVGDENGTVAVLFADSLFDWRSSAQRVFVNFTDEPTFVDYNEVWNTENMCTKLGGKATVHTVFSADTNYNWINREERPWDMSICTGGTYKFYDRYATGLDLSDLPVAGALANSYSVEFMSANAGATHTVEITVKETGADGKKVYENISY